MFIFTLFVQSKVFDVYNLEHPGQMYTILKFPEMLTISPHFDYTFVYISRHLRVFAS